MFNWFGGLNEISFKAIGGKMDSTKRLRIIESIGSNFHPMRLGLEHSIKTSFNDVKQVLIQSIKLLRH